MFKELLKPCVMIVLVSLSFASSTAIFSAWGQHDGTPAFLGVWGQVKNSNRVLDTTITSGNLTLNLNVTNAHSGGLTGINGFDITVTYNPALLRARAAGIASFPIFSGVVPAGARLEPLCTDAVAAGIPPTAGVALKDDTKIRYFDANVNNVWNGPTGPEPATGETIIYDLDNDGVYDAGEPVIRWPPAPTVGTLLKDDPKIKYVDANNNDVRDSVEPVIYDSNANGLYDDGCIFDLAGRTIFAFRVELDVTVNLDGTVTPTPGRSRVFVAVGGGNASPDGVALRFRFDVRALESVVYDSDNDGVYDSGEPVIAGAPPTAGTALKDDGNIKYRDTDSDNIRDATEAVVYSANTVYDAGEPVIAGSIAPGTTVEDTDTRVKYVDPNNNNVWNTSAPSDSSNITIDETKTQLTVGAAQQIRYIKIDGFFSNQATASNYGITVTPSSASVMPTQGTTATVSVSTLLGSPGPVNLAARAVSPVSGAEFPTADPTVGVTFGTPSGTPPFTSTMAITTTISTIRRDVGVSGIHTIIVNATSATFPRGVITTFRLTVEFPAIDFTLSLSRDILVLRPGENSPDVRFIDADGDGVYDLGETLLLDANLDGIVNLGAPNTILGDTVVSVDPRRAPTPQVRSIDANFNTGYDLGETLVFDSNLDKKVDSGDTVVSTTPIRAPDATELGKDLVEVNTRLSFLDANSNGLYDLSEKLVLDSNRNGAVDISPGAGATLLDDSRIKYVDANDNNVRDSGETVTVDQNSNGEYDVAETVISGTSPSFRTVVKDDPKLKYVDANANAVWNLGEAVAYDTNSNNSYNTGEPVIAGDTVVSESPARSPTAAESGLSLKGEIDKPLRKVGEVGVPLLRETKIRFIDANGNTAYNLGETLVYDSDSTNSVGAADTVVSQSPPRIPTAGELGQALLDISKVRFLDQNEDGVYNIGETLVFDTQPNGIVDSADTIVSASTRPPIARVKFVDGAPGSGDLNRYNLGETLVFDANNNGAIDSGDRIVSTTPHRAPLAGELGLLLKEVEISIAVNWAGGGPENVVLLPRLSDPRDSTLVTAMERALGEVSGPVVPGVETRIHSSTVTITTQPTTGTFEPWLRLPIAYKMGIEARSDLSIVTKNVNITLIIAPLGYRYDLPFDYKLTASSPTPLPPPASASGNRVQLDKGQSITVQITMDVTQGLPQNVTLTVAVVDPTITVTITGIQHSTAALSSFATTITITTTTGTPSVTGGYTIVTASPTGGSPPTPADEVIKLCVLFRGDVNNDGTVNVSDLARVGASFLKSTGQPGFDPEADINKDGTVNVLDLVVVGAEFLKSC